MKRRLFSKLMAMGAASFPFMQLTASAEGDDVTASEEGHLGGEQREPEENALALAQTEVVSVEPQPVNVFDMIELSKATLPKATFDYITTGSEDEVTLKDNVAAFRRIRVIPPLLTGVGEADLSTTILGQKISLPIILAPVAIQRMFHPEGVLASARAADKAGTIMGVSSSVGHSVEEVAAATKGPKWYQLYVPKDRKVTRRLVERVEKAGYEAIILTVDLGERKDADRRNKFTLPKEMLLKHLRDIGFTHLNEKTSYEELIAFNAQAWDLALDWTFFKWLRSITKLPILIKGVLSKDDALKAIELGLDGIVVSNHGGRRLDGMPATIDVLPEIADAVNGRVDLLMDSGIRRGTDVLKAMALGAKAVLIGRPYAWGLSVGGEAGVTQVLDFFREELTMAMVTSGCATVADIDDSLIVGEKS